jgi:predicted ATPase/class 3 adenylate cyclase
MEPETSGGEVLSFARPRRGVALPSGDVTFVLTDIEGSTRLLAELGDRFGPLLAVHRSIVAGAMAEVGGVLVNAEGDEMFFACPEAGAAVQGVLAAQAAMADYAWPPGGEFRIRVGLHTGPARPIGNSYIALAVHQAARISAAGHGGQVLASATTAALVDRTCRELGRFRLKDFDEPVAIVQYDDGDHPPLKVVPEAVRRLVLPDTSFVGREVELAELAKLLDAHRVVSICGPGGAGKTRLAVELASSRPSHVRVAVAELVGARNDVEVASAVAASLDLAQSTDVGVLELVMRYVADLDHAVLVLDNCEQVLEPVADVVTALSTSAPDVRFLLTTREPVGIPDERVLRLAPLLPPQPGTTLADLLEADAARLLVDRVMARDPGFQLSKSDVDHVVAICQHLDGSPLALELVAAEVAAAGLAAARQSVELGARLDGGRGRPARHRSIEAALDWSYQLLEPAERVVWARLAVFVSAFRLVDAVAVASDADLDERAVRSAVTALVNKSVITRVSAPDGDRYLMHQAVREFGQARLRDLGELESTEDRHAGWAKAFLDANYYTATPPDWFKAYGVCRDDLVAAWHHLRGIGDVERGAMVGANTAYWDYFTCRAAEGAELLAEIATWPDGPYLAGPLIRAGSIVARQGDATRARTFLQQAMRHPLEPKVEAAAHDTLIQICLEEGDFAPVEEHARTMLTRPIPDAAPSAHAWALSMLSLCAICRDDLAAGIRHGETSMRHYIDLSQDLNACIMSVNVAAVMIVSGDLTEARQHAERALDIAESARMSDQAWVARMLIAGTEAPRRPNLDLRRALDGLVSSEMPLELGDFYQSIPVLARLEQWRALAVAAGAFSTVYAAAPNPFPLLDRLLDDAETACRGALADAEYEDCFARGCATPTYAEILAAVD